MGIGEVAALGAAFMWTLSSMVWGRIHMSALGINLCKNIIGTILIALHIVALVAFVGHKGLVANLESWWWLSISGLIGIVVGDTIYFRSLQIMGPRRALMMATTGPIFAAVLGWGLLSETLAFWAIFGILMTVAGVILVVADRKAKVEEPGLMPGSLRDGMLLGLAGAVCQAIGGVFSKMGMVNSEGVETCDAIEATFIRFFISAIATLAFVVAKRKLKEIATVAMQWKSLKLLIPATIVGSWLGVWFSQISYQRSDVAIAQTLLATCPLFAIPIVWLSEGHKITLLSIVGTLVALAGIYLTVS